MNISPKEQLINHLSKFTSQRILAGDIDEYWVYQEHGGKINPHNPLLDAQRWREWVLTSLIEESFEFWGNNWGWIYPLLHEIEYSGGKINGQFEVIEKGSDSIWESAILRIIKKISKVGILEFYKKHPRTDKTKIKKILEIKYN